MKLYISADMEGTAAVSAWTQVDPKNTSEYPYYRKLMSLEVRAAIDGARAAGVTSVLVNDSHSSMRNVMWDELPDDVRMIYGNRKPLSMTQGADARFAAAFFTGYHAAIGVATARSRTRTRPTPSMKCASTASRAAKRSSTPRYSASKGCRWRSLREIA